jgi:outer membrane protein insertion porin family
MKHAHTVFGRASVWLSRAALPCALVAGFPLAAQDAETLKEIDVIGAQKLSKETVLFRAGVKVGDDARNLDFTSMLERLWSTNGFDDVKFELEDVEGGKKLIIRVKERPIIKEVDYRGGTEIGLTSIKDKIKEKKLTINPDTIYDPETARKVKNQIVDQAAEKGFRNPVVDVLLEPVGPGVARLVFDIKEGGKVRIYKVAFRGNKVISDGTLRRAMKKTRQHWMFSWLTSHDLLTDKNLEDDLQNVKKTYWREGYKDVFVGQPTIEVQDFTSERQKKKNEKRIREAKSPKYDLRATLTVPILEGDKFFEGSYKVEGNKLFKDEFFKVKYAEVKRDNKSFIKKFFNIRPSLKEPGPNDKPVPFDLDALNQTVDKLREAYNDRSHIQFRAEKIFETREEKGVKKVDTTLKVNEGEPFTIRRIEFEGNNTTKDKVIRRSMLLREGDPFSAAAFKDSMLRISQLSFFDIKTSEPKVDLVPDKNEVDIVIRGEEAGVNELLFQGGYGQLFGFSLGASFSTRNLGGGGETLGFSYNGGKFQKSFSVSFTEPYVFDLPYSFSASLANTSSDYSAARVGNANAYRQTSKSLGFSVGAQLSNWFKDKQWAYFTNYGIGYTYRLISVEGGSSIFFRNISNQLASTVTQSLTYNTVDHPFKPTRGTKLGMTLEYGGWQFGGDRPFLRSSWEFAKYGTLAERHTFAANFNYGYLRNLSNEDIQTYELYRPGGENSIRGYRYGQVGSVLVDPNNFPIVIGGNKQFLANFEYQFKIADQFRTVLFYDAGNAWAPGTKIFSTNTVTYILNGQTVSYRNPKLVSSYGIEFRFFLPISPAPLRLIWSRKLNPYPFDTESRTDFQFSIGTTF